MSSPKVSILGISGGNRSGSYNTALLEAARELLPENATIEIASIPALPIYSQDIERSPPPEVIHLKERVKSADAILIATPEHNYSIPAVLKNTIEWVARPPRDNSWSGKPAAIVSASSGVRGGVRAQMHLRSIMVDLNMHPINIPQLYVGNESTRFDENRRLADPEMRAIYEKLLKSLVEWTIRLRG